MRAHGDRFAPPIVVCNQEHRFLIAEQLRAAGIASPRILLEPIGRNSAPAIAAAAMLVAETTPDAVLWLLAADHAIADTRALHAALAIAATAARAGRIVTFGMRPTAPETGYGYIATRRRAARRRAPTRSRSSWKSRVPRRPPAWPPTGGICGTPGCSCSPRAPCWRT